MKIPLDRNDTKPIYLQIRDRVHRLITSGALKPGDREYLASGHFRHRLNHLRTWHLQSRNAMLQALTEHFPQEATWTVPAGGLLL